MEQTQTETETGNGEGTWGEAAKASAEAGEKSWEPTRPEFERELRCALTEHEKADRLDKVARLRAERDRFEADKKETIAGFKAALERVETAIADIVDEARNGAKRMVDCREEANDAGTVRVVRLDTGDILDERPMTAAERQGALDLDEAPDGDDLPPDGEDDLEDDLEDEPGDESDADAEG